MGSDVRVAVDVGANRGQTIVSLNTMLPHVRIVALEANPHFVKRLRAMQRRYDGLTTLGVGCSSFPEVRLLHVPTARGTAFDQWATFSPPDRVTMLRMIRDAGFTWCCLEDVDVEETPCASMPLDLILAGRNSLSVDLLKIDVEGAEREVLLGAHGLLTEHRPIVLAERATSAFDLLEPLGYVMWHSRTSQNTLFVHPEHRRRIDQHLLASFFRP